MDDRIKLPLLTSLHLSDPFRFLNNETSYVTITVQMAIYTTLNYQGTFNEHYMGIIPISKLVRTKLSAPNIMKFLI